MRKYELITLISLVLVIAIPVIILFVYNPQESTDHAKEPHTQEQDKNKDSETENKDEDNSKNKDNNKDSNKDQEKDKDKNKEKEEEADKDDKKNENHWGVDSASYTDEEFLGCVVDNYGKPVIWGRYLGEKEGVSAGLDSDEVKLLHDNDIKILVIYNHVEDARGHDNGVEHAKQAISMAEDLEIPEGVAIFVDIEPEYPVDAAFIEGWYTTITDSNYEPGVYGVFSEENELLNAYNDMAKEAIENTIVWTAYPQEDITTKEDAPEYNPQGPENAKTFGWQYAIDGETCNIDTNIFNGNMMDFVW
ncbi:glycoside hydrolase domain-containing protein [Paucisalibacillus sp. EB02]|uniref:glycoside hydrolase domain-containing protein n=1 Tax=Paucisalibacillus sp. EB02 TaxID=1347087 RepID=UPI0005A5F920|nr:glycoside hydrolase domain-containing protein [Paucisalibacillus sp. EB02]